MDMSKRKTEDGELVIINIFRADKREKRAKKFQEGLFEKLRLFYPNHFINYLLLP